VAGAAEPHPDGTAATPLPSDLVRALNWLRSHIAEPIDLMRLADVAGVPPRTLETHFKVFLKTTPLTWVRRMRLANARRELQRGRLGDRVTNIALASGFTQLGRFAGQYRTMYGETPSLTMRRSRGRSEGSAHAIDDEALRLTWQAIPQVFAIAPQECSAALEALEQASRRSPQYGLPVSLAAWCWGQRAAHGFSATPHKDRDHGLRLVEQACALAPHDALALTLASGALTLAHRLDDADRLLERVLALDPWLPYAWVRRGWASVYVGDPDGALRELQIALHLAPTGPMRHIAFIGIACAHFACRRYERAALWARDGTAGYPGAVWADRITAAAAAHAGAHAEGRRVARRLLRKDPNLTVARAKRAWPFRPAFMNDLGRGLEIAGVPQG
jgi:AraC-like DNA-binding protein